MRYFPLIVPAWLLMLLGYPLLGMAYCIPAALLIMWLTLRKR